MDRYSIVEAYFWFFTNCHGGQGSDEYRRLSKMSRYFRPGACSTGPEPDSEAAYLYVSLLEKAGFDLNETERAELFPSD